MCLCQFNKFLKLMYIPVIEMVCFKTCIIFWISAWLYIQEFKLKVSFILLNKKKESDQHLILKWNEILLNYSFWSHLLLYNQRNRRPIFKLLQDLIRSKNYTISCKQFGIWHYCQWTPEYNFHQMQIISCRKAKNYCIA